MRKNHRNSGGRKRHVPGQKPHGCFQERVKQVGPEHFGIIAVDCGKPEARARVADFYGNVLLEPFSFEISRPGLAMACAGIEQTFAKFQIHDCVAAIETTGRYHRPVKKSFQDKNWESRDVHPFTSNLFRRAADESNKTDDTDLAAIHRAAIDGLAMRPEVLDLTIQQWRLLVRHRRDLVEKAASLKIQLKEIIEAYLPGFSRLWKENNFWESPVPATIATTFESAAAMQVASEEQFRQAVREVGSVIHLATIRRIRGWTHHAAPADDGHSICYRRARSLWSDLQAKSQEIRVVELDLADFLCDSTGLLLLAFPGIHVVTASDYAAELGLITNYATSKSIAGRAGLYPSRYQTCHTDLANGPLSVRRNRQLRAALMRLARNLNRSNEYFLGMAQSYRNRSGQNGFVVIARSFSRLSYYLLAGGCLFPHPAIQHGEKILQKLLEFYQEHQAEPDRTTAALDQAISRLRVKTLSVERQALTQMHQKVQQKRRSVGLRRLGEILPDVLLRIDQRLEEKPQDDNQTSIQFITKAVSEDVTHGS